MLKSRRALKTGEKRWLLVLFLLPLVPLVLLRLQKREAGPRFVFRLTPNSGGPRSFASGLAYSPDGRTLACAFAVERGRKIVGGQLRLWTPAEIRFYDSQGGSYRQSINLNSGTVNDLVFSRDGKTLRGNCGDGFTRWWDVASGRMLRRVWQGRVWPLATSADGRWQIAQQEPKPKSPPYNYYILVRDNNNGKVVRRFTLGERPITAAAFSPDGRQCVLVGDNGPTYANIARWYRTSDWKVISKQNWGDSYIFWMEFASQSQIVGVDGQPFSWKEGAKMKGLGSSAVGDLRCGAISADGQWLAAGGFDIDPPWQSKFEIDYRSEGDPDAWFGEASVWDIRTEKCLWRQRTGGKGVGAVALSPDKSQLAVTVSGMWHEDARGGVEVWPVSPAKP